MATGQDVINEESKDDRLQFVQLVLMLSLHRLMCNPLPGLLSNAQSADSESKIALYFSSTHTHFQFSHYVFCNFFFFCGLYVKNIKCKQSVCAVSVLKKAHCG